MMPTQIPHPDAYTYRVEWDHDEQRFRATVAEFPTLTFTAVTPEDARAQLKAVVHQTLVSLHDSGAMLPMPIPRYVPPPPPPPPPPYAAFPVPANYQNVNVRVGGGRGFVSTNHTFHLIMTVITCGMWAPVWIIMAIVNGSRNAGR